MAVKSNMSKDFAKKASLRDCAPGMADGGYVNPAAMGVVGNAQANRLRQIDSQVDGAQSVAAPTAQPVSDVQTSYGTPQAPARQKPGYLDAAAGIARELGGAASDAISNVRNAIGPTFTKGLDGMSRALEPVDALLRNPIGRAQGGAVAGPGGPTDDKIPANLSDGEYVLPADTVQAVGKHKLDALRHATHHPVKMADGGIASAADALRNRGKQVDGAIEGPKPVAPKAPAAAPAEDPDAAVGIHIPKPAPAPPAKKGLFGLGILGLANGGLVEEPWKASGLITPATQPVNYSTTAGAPADGGPREVPSVDPNLALRAPATAAPTPDQNRMTDAGFTRPGMDATQPGADYNTLRSAAMAPTGALPAGVNRVGNTFFGSGDGSQAEETARAQGRFEKEKAGFNSLIGSYINSGDLEHANKLAYNDETRAAVNNAYAERQKQAAAATQQANANAQLSDPHLTRSQRANLVAMRGQDLQAATSTRGQDLQASTAHEGQQVAREGHMGTLQLGMINAQRAAAMEQARFQLDTQKFGLEGAKEQRASREQAHNDFYNHAKDFFGLNDKDGGSPENRGKFNDAMTKLQNTAAQNGFTLADIPPEMRGQAISEAAQAQNLDATRTGVFEQLKDKLGGRQSFTPSNNLRDYRVVSGAAGYRPGAVYDDVRTGAGDVNATDFAAGKNTGYFPSSDPLNKQRLEEVGRAQKSLRRSKE